MDPNEIRQLAEAAVDDGDSPHRTTEPESTGDRRIVLRMVRAGQPVPDGEWRRIVGADVEPHELNQFKTDFTNRAKNPVSQGSEDMASSKSGAAIILIFVVVVIVAVILLSLAG